MLSNDRPTFYYNNDKDKPIRAGGIIFYKKDNDDIKILLIKDNDRYEDIGGRTDIKDITIIDTVSREVEEETNNVIKSNNIKNILITSQSFYIPHGKYIIYLVEADNYIKNLDSSVFGDIEIHDNIHRTIKWVNINKYIYNKKKFNPRIMSNEIKEYIQKNICS
jgi:ADP-ribose pyrophosphatase YjhB (NUDIX family)